MIEADKKYYEVGGYYDPNDGYSWYRVNFYYIQGVMTVVRCSNQDAVLEATIIPIDCGMTMFVKANTSVIALDKAQYWFKVYKEREHHEWEKTLENSFEKAVKNFSDER